MSKVYRAVNEFLKILCLCSKTRRGNSGVNPARFVGYDVGEICLHFLGCSYGGNAELCKSCMAVGVILGNFVNLTPRRSRFLGPAPRTRRTFGMTDFERLSTCSGPVGGASRSVGR